MSAIQFYNATLLDCLPCLCVLKDEQSNYIGFNQEAMNLLQINDRNEVLGRSDYDMPWKEYADRYIEQDKISLKGKKCIDILPTTRADGSKTLLLAQKGPLYSDSGKIIGVTGISLHLSREKYHHIISLLASANMNMMDFTVTVNKKNPEFVYGEIAFTKRQAQIVGAVLKGHSSDSAAKVLDLSKRTVEAYIKIIKDKLKCEKKSDIVNKAFEYGFIDLMFMRII